MERMICEAESKFDIAQMILEMSSAITNIAKTAGNPGLKLIELLVSSISNKDNIWDSEIRNLKYKIEKRSKCGVNIYSGNVS